MAALPPALRHSGPVMAAVFPVLCQCSALTTISSHGSDEYTTRCLLGHLLSVPPFLEAQKCLQPPDLFDETPNVFFGGRFALFQSCKLLLRRLTWTALIHTTVGECTNLVAYAVEWWRVLPSNTVAWTAIPSSSLSSGTQGCDSGTPQSAQRCS